MSISTFCFGWMKKVSDSLSVVGRSFTGVNYIKTKVYKTVKTRRHRTGEIRS